MGKILFQLTPEIIDMIIFGMENQSDAYCVDIKTGNVLSGTDASEEYDDTDSFVLSVPDWLPADGFQLMEGFVAALHNPVYKETLRKVLSEGRGAFRNFKNTIKEHESLTQQWYLHKEKVMRSRVIEWYNLNSEILKYRNIDENTDETENLVLSDFVFTIDCPKWKNFIVEKSDESILESMGDKEAVIAEYLISRNKFCMDVLDNTPIFVCAETVEGEFAGCINGCIVETGVSHLLVAVANTIWVERKFRGMGLARQLIDDFSKNAILLKAERIIFELPGRGFSLNSTLESRGAATFITTMAVNAGNL